ncbi:hypothetical protein MCOR06_011517 [Pyricularia oryzae]|nr:hypothetical protein MCOR01_004974 [Pyricularia oryzae]KAI6507100.1 hypothetical protein MCOR16_011857 [Pyricularia oryzae]KAI6573790.1 hypothetical protein MCOR06_011517 [Pyricularia oryzae]
MFFSTFLSLTILLLTFGGALPVPPPSSSPHLTSPELVLPDQEWRRSRPTAMIRKRAPYPWEFGWPFSSTSPSSSPSPKKSQPSIASSWWTPSSWGLWGQKKSAQGVPTSGGIPPNKNQQKTTHGGVPKQQATAKNTQYPPKSNTWPLTPPPRQEEIKRKPVPAKVDSLQSAKVSASLKPGPPSGNPSKEPFKSSAPWGAGWYSNLGPDPYQGQYRAYEPPTVSQHEKEKNPKKPTDAPQTATNIVVAIKIISIFVISFWPIAPSSTFKRPKDATGSGEETDNLRFMAVERSNEYTAGEAFSIYSIFIFIGCLWFAAQSSC